MSTHPPHAPDRPSAPERSAYGPAVLALGVGGFGIGTGEFAIMGLLPEVAADLGVSIPQAGHVISAYALGVVVGAPVLAVLGARLERRALLMALMACFALGNFASALAPGYVSLSLLRFAAGLPHGTYFGVAALVAAGLAPAGRRAAAVGHIMLGLTVAVVVGVPLAAWMGEGLGWRAAFALVGAIGLLAVALVHRWVPRTPAPAQASARGELRALARAQVWLTLGVGAVGFGGLFSVFSYIKPTLLQLAQLPPPALPFALALLGLGMVAGNGLGPRFMDRHLMGTIAGILLWGAAVLALFALTAPVLPLALASTFLVGTLGALGPALQVRLMDVAGEGQSLAAALNHSAFNAANALGAWLGGLAIALGWGWAATGWVGAALALGGLAVFGVSLVLQRRTLD
ncbi:MFS transporter [Pulveribacter suum]|uniref:MFS transporter n=1 Tax=Pulveribacter suum TaxID=2116657 RepID=A0A2P1NMU7_9BURK|nr:MFS transporter [Pulveribacter suum]AVP58371.1 MFS transporter [Pulveribacter suum]